MAKESSKSSILVAVIGAAATIVAAVIGWLSHSSGSNPPTHSDTINSPVISGNYNSAIAGNNNSSISNSPGATIGEVYTPFDMQNAIHIGKGFGTYVEGNPPSWMHKSTIAWFMIDVSNASHRDLKNVSFFIFPNDETDGKPALSFRTDDIAVHEHEQQKFVFDQNRPLPQSVMICVSFDGERPNQYVNVLHSAIRRDTAAGHNPPQVTYSYKLEGKYRVFMSNRANDCAGKGKTQVVDISNSKFFY